MLNLAIQIDVNRNNKSVVETNNGVVLEAHDWPQDCEAQVVSYHKESQTCRVIRLDKLTQDIRQAVAFLNHSGVLDQKKPDWFLRLRDCSKPAD